MSKEHFKDKDWRENPLFGRYFIVGEDLENEFMSPNFQWKEAMCPCCNGVYICLSLLRHLELIKEHTILKLSAGFQVIVKVNSWCRCVKHNASLRKSSLTSDHLIEESDLNKDTFEEPRVARAVDIVIKLKDYPKEGDYYALPTMQMYAIVEELNLFNVMGAYPTFLHLAMSEKGYNRWITDGETFLSLKGISRK